MKIEIDDEMLRSGGYTKLKSDTQSDFIDNVNKKLSAYWVLTGRERNIENAMFEVLAEKYDEKNKQTENVCSNCKELPATLITPPYIKWCTACYEKYAMIKD